MSLLPMQTDTQPTFNDKLQGALSNPLLQIGLGILASNNSKNAGQVIGRGGLLGMQNIQQNQQMQQLNDIRKSQVDVLKRRQDLEDKQYNDTQNALARLIERNPELADLYAIDPKAAIKAAFPQANSVDPYFSPVYDSQRGLGAFNARTGQTTWQSGAPIIKPADDPNLQRVLSFNKEYGKGQATPTNMEDGVIQSEAQLIDKVSPNLPNVNYLPPNVPRLQQGQQSNPWQIPPEVQAQRDKGAKAVMDYERGQGVGNAGITPPMPYNLPTGGGIKVPTKAEEAAQVESAKENAKFNSPEATKKREMANQFKKTTAQNVINAIDGVMQRVDGWSAGTGGNIMRALPFNNDAKDIMADLETVKANFGFDRLQIMRDMSPTGGALGQVAVQELTALQASVANLSAENQSPEQLKRNLQKAKTHYENWLATLDGEKSDGSILPPAGAIEKLRADPSLAPYFNQKYGEGAAERALGQ